MPAVSRENGVVNENRLRVVPNAFAGATGLSAIGARIVEAAERACAMHMQVSGGHVSEQDIADLLRQIPADG